MIVSGFHRRRDPNNDDNVVNIFVWPGAPLGTWTVTIIPRSLARGEVHGWIERVQGGRQSVFESADSSFTTNTICNGRRTITVAACDVRSGIATPGRFSSSGPTRDLRHKPDLAAPGVGIRSAMSTVVVEGQRRRNGLTVMSGTSMAAPHVAGSACLVFEAGGRHLWAEDVRQILTQTAAPVANTPSRVGHGLVDIDAAVSRARTWRSISSNRVARVPGARQ